MSIREFTVYQALLLVFTLCFAIPAQAAQTPLKKEGYYALVIGNGAYRGSARLPNAVNDASAIRDSLKELGYTVIYGQDLDWEQTHKKINEFIRAAPRMKAAAFFYSGHAVQIRGSNYLVTADARFNSEKNMVRSLWSMQPLFEDIAKRSDTGLLILDSCRNNPFGKQIRTSARQNRYNITRSISVINEQSSMSNREYYQSRAIGRAPEPAIDRGTRTAQQPRRLTAAQLKIGKGLAKTSVNGNMFIAYATSPGQVAADGRGKHSPFTAGLLKYMKTPDLEVEPMFAKVRRHVFKTTGRTQRPWNTSGLIDPFYMNRRALPDTNKRVATFYRPEPAAKREEIYTEPVLQQPDVKPATDNGPKVRNRTKKSGKARQKARTKIRVRRNAAKKARTKRKTARRTKPKARAKKKVARRTKPKARAKKKVARRTKPKARARVAKKRVSRPKRVRTRRTARAAPKRRNTGGSPTSNGFIGF